MSKPHANAPGRVLASGMHRLGAGDAARPLAKSITVESPEKIDKRIKSAAIIYV